jgi:hypothetical protein
LRETRKQHIHELNSLQTEKSFLLLKIQDLEEKLLETQLKFETGLGYVASSSDIPSTFRSVFVKPTVPEPPSISLDKGKEVIDGDVPASAIVTQKPHIIRRPPICHHCGLSGHIRPQCSPSQSSKIKSQERVAKTSYIRN